MKTYYYQLNCHSNSLDDSTFEDYEYNGNKYALLDNSMSWVDAMDYCSSLGGHLVVIDNQEEQTFLTSLMQQHGNKNLYWIGLSGEDDQCSWVTGVPLSFQNWGGGEPNNSSETAVHMYCKEQGGFSTGQWNDTYNYYEAGSSFFWSTSNCGIICEWEEDVDNVQTGYWIRLSNDTMVKLDKDPSLGDETVDSDLDGIPDLIELYPEPTTKTVFDPLTHEQKIFEEWDFFSNPKKIDTDDDDLSDFKDLYPTKFDTRIVSNDDKTIVFNTGRTWNNITCNSFDYLDNFFQFIDYNIDNPIPIEEFRTILDNVQKNSDQNFSQVQKVGVNSLSVFS